MTKIWKNGKIENEMVLLKRHLYILKVVLKNEPIGIIRLSEELKLPQHKVRYSLRILEEEGLIEPSTEGASTTKKLPAFIKNLRSLIGSLDGIVDEIYALQKK